MKTWRKNGINRPVVFLPLLIAALGVQAALPDVATPEQLKPYNFFQVDVKLRQ